MRERSIMMLLYVNSGNQSLIRPEGVCDFADTLSGRHRKLFCHNLATRQVKTRARFSPVCDKPRYRFEAVTLNTLMIKVIYLRK